MQAKNGTVAKVLFTAVGLILAGARAEAVEAVFPGQTWAKRSPAEVGCDAGKLKEFSRFVANDPGNVWIHVSEQETTERTENRPLRYSSPPFPRFPPVPPAAIHVRCKGTDR